MRLDSILVIPRPSEISDLTQRSVAPSLTSLDGRVELNKEFGERVSELAFVNPGGESGEERYGEGFEETRAEIADEGVAIGGVRVEGGEERTAYIVLC